MTTILNQITDKLANRLESTAIATEVIRPKRLGDWTPRNNQVVIIPVSDDMEPNEDWSCQGNPPAQAWTLPVLLVCTQKDDETTTEDIDSKKSTYAAEVMKAVTSPAAWWNWDGLAVDSRFGPITDYDGGEIAAHQVTLNIIFRTDENNPFNAR